MNAGTTMLLEADERCAAAAGSVTASLPAGSRPLLHPASPLSGTLDNTPAAARQLLPQLAMLQANDCRTCHAQGGEGREEGWGVGGYNKKKPSPRRVQERSTIDIRQPPHSSYGTVRNC